MEVAHNLRSSDEASQRIKRRFEVLRRKGVPHLQGRSFGFPGLDRTVARDAEDRAAVSSVLGERAAGREVRALLAGAHLVNISDEWNAAGLLTVTGKAWTP
jgi:hypothetical protein